MARKAGALSGCLAPAAGRTRLVIASMSVVDVCRCKVPGFVQTIGMTEIDPLRFLFAPAVGLAIGRIPADFSRQSVAGAVLVRNRCALVSGTHLDLLDFGGSRDAALACCRHDVCSTANLFPRTARSSSREKICSAPPHASQHCAICPCFAPLAGASHTLAAAAMHGQIDPKSAHHIGYGEAMRLSRIPLGAARMEPEGIRAGLGARRVNAHAAGQFAEGSRSDHSSARGCGGHCRAGRMQPDGEESTQRRR